MEGADMGNGHCCSQTARMALPGRSDQYQPCTGAFSPSPAPALPSGAVSGDGASPSRRTAVAAIFAGFEAVSPGILPRATIFSGRGRLKLLR